jgi:hypothetical protein
MASRKYLFDLRDESFLNTEGQGFDDIDEDFFLHALHGASKEQQQHLLHSTKTFICQQTSSIKSNNRFCQLILIQADYKQFRGLTCKVQKLTPWSSYARWIPSA